jgi:hypothetical protein
MACTPAEAVARAMTPFAAVAGPGDHPDLGQLAVLAAALEADPALVLAVGRAEPRTVTPDPVLHPWAFALSEGPGPVDGHLLARGALDNAANVLGPPGAVVVRCSAVGDGDGVGGTAADAGAHLGLWLTLLGRGPAWYDPARAAVAEGDADGFPGWSALVDLAVACGLLEPQDAERALVARLARLGAVAGRRLERGEPVGGALAAAVRDLAGALGSWPAELQGPAVDVLVLCEGGHALARRSAEAAAWARHVLVVDRSGAALPEGGARGGAQWLAADWSGQESAGLLARGDRPVLVVAEGELPELLDAAQVAKVAAAAGPGFAAEVGGATTSEVRLVFPGPGADAQIGSSSPVRLHAVHLGAPDEPDWLPMPADSGPGSPLRFVIAAPGYRPDSGGVVAMHRLCDVLNRLGHRAVILPLDGRAATCPGWDTPLVTVPAAVEGAVVVYPEIVTGNPLGAAQVVRWLLNRPGYVSGRPTGAGPDDLVVAWNRAIDPALPVLTLPLFDPRVFFPKDAPARGALLWVGKGQLPAAFPRARTTMITRTWPTDRPRLAALLRAADVLYSCDWMTAIAFEALLCGTPVVLVGEQRWSREELMSNGIVLPGMLFEDGDLEDARAALPETSARYRAQVAGAAGEVARFVALVDDHVQLAPRPVAWVGR